MGKKIRLSNKKVNSRKKNVTHTTKINRISYGNFDRIFKIYLLFANLLRNQLTMFFCFVCVRMCLFK